MKGKPQGINIPACRCGHGHIEHTHEPPGHLDPLGRTGTIWRIAHCKLCPCDEWRPPWLEKYLRAARPTANAVGPAP